MRSWRLGVLVVGVAVVGCAGASAGEPAGARGRPRPDAATTPQAQTPASATEAARSDPAQAQGKAQAATTAASAAALADAGAPSETASTVGGGEDRATRGDGANTFALRLFRQGLATTKGNVMLAGASVREALGLAYLGARGDTAREMATALELPPDPSDAAAALARERAGWSEARDKAELFVGSRLWVDAQQPLAPSFAEALRRVLGDAAENLDFRGSAERSRRTINAWVAERTRDKIRELLAPGSVDASSRLVVTSAVHFKGSWQLPFPDAATKDEPFHLDAKRSVNAPLMHTTDTFRFAQADGAKVLELRYAATSIAMVVVLPDALDRAERDLSPDALDRWTSELSSRRVAVTLPRFSFGGGGSMVGALRDLGVRRAFTTKADFGGIAPGPLSLSEVAHRTWIAVDEKGTEAAAATGVVMRTTSLDTSPVVEFKADRPFLFFLHDTRSRRVLFAGRVTDPSTKDR